MVDLYKLARPLLFQTDAEDAHTLTIRAMKIGLSPRFSPVQDPALEQTLWGLKFPNPVGMAAGFDKGAEVIAPILGLGFGFTEVGTVTPKPQTGNDRPRVFRDPAHEAIINRMGFPGAGAQAFKRNLEKFLSAQPKPQGVVGINIGMNKTQSEPAKDYAALIRMLAPMADYLTINISSPNTPGLRDLQSPEPLTELLGIIKEERKKACGEYPPPILLKLAPDLTEAQQQDIAQVVITMKIDGLVLGNTTLSRPECLPEKFRAQKGGLSGQPLAKLSTRVIHSFYALTKGQIPIIGVGGVDSGAQAYEKIKAGASLVQLYTALVFKGPTVAHSINTDLLKLLKNDGFKHLGDAIGAAHK